MMISLSLDCVELIVMATQLAMTVCLLNIMCCPARPAGSWKWGVQCYAFYVCVVVLPSIYNCVFNGNDNISAPATGWLECYGVLSSASLNTLDIHSFLHLHPLPFQSFHTLPPCSKAFGIPRRFFIPSTALRTTSRKQTRCGCFGSSALFFSTLAS